MSERERMLDDLKAEAQALADKVRAIGDPHGGYGPEMKALIYAASRSQEVVFFLRDAAEAAKNDTTPEHPSSGPWTAIPLRHA